MAVKADPAVVIRNERRFTWRFRGEDINFSEYIFPRFPSPCLVSLRLSMHPQWKGLRRKRRNRGKHGCNLRKLRCTHSVRVLVILKCYLADFQITRFVALFKFLKHSKLQPSFAPSRLKLTIILKYLTQVCLCSTSHNDFPRDEVETL